jgi:serine protease AprX
VNRSISTVKADAAHISFSALGKGIVWAVVDSGIEAAHEHLKSNLELDTPLAHRDFTRENDDLALVDEYGHGTHVAGIIAGHLESDDGLNAVTRYRDKEGNITAQPVETPITRMTGMAPACRLLSLKVLDKDGRGEASSIITALEYIQELNGYGRRIRVHGVNLSVGYGFEPEWFACGQSPLCVEVDRLVKSGVVVVVAAGNTGYGYVQSAVKGPPTAGLAVTINDPGNADLAITVGATHRDMPHIYGVSYFSSKGPTGDGRDKPDLVAPGEKILSCAAGSYRSEGAKQVDNQFEPDYVEDSGTSMAAPHVSGVIAAFLSIRPEFIGRPERVKEIFVSTATDLKRDRHFQGHGLVDVMRAIQSV